MKTMLDNGLKEQVRSLFSSLENQYILRAKVSDNNSQKDDLISLISDLADVSDKIKIEIEKGENLSLEIFKNNEKVNIVFNAVPTGHEFTTLLLAILNLDGKGKNLPDPIVTARIKSLKGDIEIKSYISLSCTNCPEVVQSINMMCILNPNIKHRIIDGALFEEEVNALNIQSVPTVYAGDKVLSVGRTQISDLIIKLEDIYESDKLPIADAPIFKSYDVIVAGGGPAWTSA